MSRDRAFSVGCAVILPVMVSACARGWLGDGGRFMAISGPDIGPA
jgi:hypothetical protein